MLVRRFDWMERILRLERDDRFYVCQSRIASEAIEETYLHLCDFILSQPQLFQRLEIIQSLNLLLQSASFSYHHHFSLGRKQTLIRFAPNSKFLKCTNSSSPSIVEILFCTKKMSVNFVKCDTFLICLILLKLKSSSVRLTRSSRPLT